MREARERDRQKLNNQRNQEGDRAAGGKGTEKRARCMGKDVRRERASQEEGIRGC